MFRYLFLASMTILLIGCGGGGGGNSSSPTGPSFSMISSTMTVPRAEHTQVTLKDGSVLITGGFSSASFPGAALNTAELFDPVSNTFTAISNVMQSLRTNHTATLLPDGKVLLAGGQIDNNNGNGSDTAELYDPATQTFTAVAARMTSPRGGHAAVLLNDGTVLLMGGFNNSSTALKTAEIYDPAAKTFTALGALMNSPRSEFSATLLPDGKVLIAGGQSNGIGTDTAEVFDPVAGTFTAISATTASIRASYSESRLPNGRILLAGGFPALVLPLSGVDTVEEFDPVSQAFIPISARMTSPRFSHASSLLADGSVLITGGVSNFDGTTATVLNTVERFVP